MKIYDTLKQLVRELKAEAIARSVLSNMGLVAAVGLMTGRDGKLLAGKQMIAARPLSGASYVAIDFLLPVLPWIPESVARSQLNLIDYGFGVAPTITPEDLIIAKLTAWRDNPERPYDLDDIAALLDNCADLDQEYIGTRIKAHSLVIPERLLSKFE